MDHQWANVAYTKDKWVWFSIQLDSDEEILCYEYNDGKVKSYLASISNKNGSNEHSTRVILEANGRTWTSPKTKAVYPIDWRIRIPEKNIDLVLTAEVKNQEVIFGSINYWEGPLQVVGTFKGRDVVGKGFLELVGYPSKYTDLKYAEDLVKGALGKIVAFTKKSF